MARAQGSPAFPASALCSRRGACSDKSVSRRRAFRRRREPPRKRRPYPSIRPFVDRGPRSPPEYRAPHRAAAPLRGVSLLYAAAPRSAAHSRGSVPLAPPPLEKGGRNRRVRQISRHFAGILPASALCSLPLPRKSPPTRSGERTRPAGAKPPRRGGFSPPYKPSYKRGETGGTEGASRLLYAPASPCLWFPRAAPRRPRCRQGAGSRRRFPFTGTRAGRNRQDRRRWPGGRITGRGRIAAGVGFSTVSL